MASRRVLEEKKSILYYRNIEIKTLVEKMLVVY